MTLANQETLPIELDVEASLKEKILYSFIDILLLKDVNKNTFGL